MLEVKGLSFRHKGQREETLRGVSFWASPGSVTVVLGPNGSGKSTLFKCIVGLWTPSRGEVIAQGRDARRLSFRERAKLFAVVPQEHEPPFPYRVLDVVLMGRASHVGVFSSPQKKDYDRAQEAVEMLGIGHIREKAYTKISGGERQLVLIARALAQEAPIMVLDEPTSHLDFRNQIQVLVKVRTVARERGKTVLVTLHDPNLASLFSDHVVVVAQGTVMCEGTPRGIITETLIKRVYNVDTKLLSFNGQGVLCPVVKEVTV